MEPAQRPLRVEMGIRGSVSPTPFPIVDMLLLLLVVSSCLKMLPVNKS